MCLFDFVFVCLLFVGGFVGWVLFFFVVFLKTIFVVVVCWGFLFVETISNN